MRNNKKVILIYLDCGKNEITQFPEVVLKMTNLQTLFLNSNGMKGDIPSSISSLRYLKELSLSDNKLDSIPLTIITLTRLEKIYLHYNQLTRIPLDISKLPNLKWFDAENNPLLPPPLDVIGKNNGLVDKEALAYLRECGEDTIKSN